MDWESQTDLVEKHLFKVGRETGLTLRTYGGLEIAQIAKVIVNEKVEYRST